MYHVIEADAISSFFVCVSCLNYLLLDSYPLHNHLEIPNCDVLTSCWPKAA